MVKSDRTSSTKPSTLPSMLAVSFVVAHPGGLPLPLASAFENPRLNRDWAFDTLVPNLAGSDFEEFLPNALSRSAAFLPAAFAFASLQASAGSVAACTDGLARANRHRTTRTCRMAHPLAVAA